MKKILIIFFIIIKIAFCLFFTLLTMYWTLLVAIGIKVRPQDFDLQVLFYLIFSVLIIPGLWIISLKKTPLTVKLVYLILFILYFYIPQILPSVKKQFDYDYCFSDLFYTKPCKQI